MSDQSVLLPKWFTHKGNHFGKRTDWSLIYFLIYAYLNILAQSQILSNSLYVFQLKTAQMNIKNRLSKHIFYVGIYYLPNRLRYRFAWRLEQVTFSNSIEKRGFRNNIIGTIFNDSVCFNHIISHVTFFTFQYGNNGCGVFKGRIQN